jgi:hypothetical protein
MTTRKLLQGTREIGEHATTHRGVRAQRWAQNLIDCGELKSAFKWNGRWNAFTDQLDEELAEIAKRAQAARAA